MDQDDLANRLTAWWLDIAPSRQEELLAGSGTRPAWLDESIADSGLDEATVQTFLDDKRVELNPTRDAGLNPKLE
jgi:hypothetical protein